MQERTRSRILAYAEERYAGKFLRIDVRFRGQFCYVDAYVEPRIPGSYDEKTYGETREEYAQRLRNTPTHLCRLRYLGSADSWSMAFFAYSSETYEPCFFADGSWTGTPEAAFEVSAVYLRE
jgi:hypothetical protein